MEYRRQRSTVLLWERAEIIESFYLSKVLQRIGKEMLEGVKEIILVLSGKGGVGKSTVTICLALALKEKGFKVGLLDVDLCGPSVPYLLGVEEENIFQSSEGWVPLYIDKDENLGVMSIGFLLNSRNDSVVWRGPKKTSMIKQFLTDVHWQNLDYLIIDTPPGTSDEHITILDNLRNFQNKSAILVTTPQEVAVQDVRKEISFCRKTGLPILGIIENMSAFVCPHCSTTTNIFSRGGGESLAESSNIKFLGRLPLDMSIANLADSGKKLQEVYSKSETSKFFSEIVHKINDKSNFINCQ